MHPVKFVESFFNIIQFKECLWALYVSWRYLSFNKVVYFPSGCLQANGWLFDGWKLCYHISSTQPNVWASYQMFHYTKLPLTNKSKEAKLEMSNTVSRDSKQMHFLNALFVNVYWVVVFCNGEW